MIKLFEIRDRSTFIPVFAFRTFPAVSSPEETYLWRRSGYGDSRLIMVGRLDGYGAHYDPFDWASGARTLTMAHQYIEQHFDALASGDVIDVEFILGEKPTKKISERITFPDQP